MKYIGILILTFCVLFANAQNKWSFLTSVEESLLIGDQSSLPSLGNFDDLFSNFGIRTGVHRVFTDRYAADVSFGVAGVAKKDMYVSKILPAQLTLHYNLLSHIEKLNLPNKKLNISLGVGKALYRTTAANYNEGGRFAYSNIFSLGSSLEFNLPKSGTLYFGYRHSLYSKDNIDLDPTGSLGDALGSFYTAIRWDIKGSNTKNLRLSDKMGLDNADALSDELNVARAKVKTMEKAVLQLKSMKSKSTKIDETVSDISSETTLMSTQGTTEKPIIQLTHIKPVLNNNAQNKWSFLTSVEESLLIGDQSSLPSLGNFDDLFSNFGIRTGVHRVFTDRYAADVSFGVAGVAKKDMYVSKILPAQLTLHYNLLSHIEKLNLPNKKLNISLGVGKALYRTTAANYNEGGRFAYSNIFSLGSSLEFNLPKSGTLYFGYRHSLYSKDNIDLDPTGSLGDALGSFYTAIRWDIKGSNTKNLRLSDKMGLDNADALSDELNVARAKVKTMEKAVLQLKSMKSKSTKIDETVSDISSETTLMSTQGTTEKPIIQLTHIKPVPTETVSDMTTEKTLKSPHGTMEKAVEKLKPRTPAPAKIDEAVSSDMSSETTLMSTQGTIIKPNVKKIHANKYAVIIASYKSEDAAKSMARKLGNAAQVIPVPVLGRYRVAYDVYDTYQEAMKFQKEAVGYFDNCWIVKL